MFFFLEMRRERDRNKKKKKKQENVSNKNRNKRLNPSKTGLFFPTALISYLSFLFYAAIEFFFFLFWMAFYAYRKLDLFHSLVFSNWRLLFKFNSFFFHISTYVFSVNKINRNLFKKKKKIEKTKRFQRSVREKEKIKNFL